MQSFYLLFLSFVFSLLFVVHIADAQNLKTVKSQLKDQIGVSMTVYSNGRALIRDRRKINLEKGQLALEIQDVSAQMRAETAQIRNVNSPYELFVHEQNLEFDLLSPRKLLEKYLGKKVTVIRTHPTNGTDTEETAEVLSVQDGPILRVKDRIETGLPARISFPELPENLRAEPTLNLIVESKKRGEQEVELNYLSDGLSWKADYIADLNADENRIQLNGFVTLTNQSGTSYRNTRLQLMAGDVQLVDNSLNPVLKTRKNLMYLEAAPAATSAMEEESFFEYHLYTLPRETSILTNQTKQLSLLQSSEVAARKEIVFLGGGETFYEGSDDDFVLPPSNSADGVDQLEFGTPLKGSIYFSFENDRKSGLGVPLPAGTIRVYKRDKSLMSQFLGEDNLKHMAENERARFKLGTSFDVTARKRRISFKTMAAAQSNRKSVRTVEYSNQIVFKNAKEKEQSVVFRDVIPGEGKIIQSNRDFRVLGQGSIEWKMVVPAKGRISLEFSARTQLKR